ncbi:MAG: bifunctional phosphopantothenoylcysteine decarboxylase/phosphopantothenate--cysteine ligase CoaBC [Marinifilaceae bacterium]|jgi:phosphopantothenoylcysteine decarboxylase/phosphopantothenate--cysteine ligase|nr:bifunctional phosphopantothenoylcysteine decarboxylase/phosphopantothenate--cysteine ligase CoaBC [Marinilabiliaceae bacterium JC040]MCT4599566.1 bifunctional phosphopantothenoylcysteine decarboxylase/phosphopantothenate--cysteine ligase CoaBC [Marinifilaceae bacterium]
MLKGKNIILGISGGIAAYKCATFVRGLVKQGANVKVIMTKHAKEFITPLTMATLSKNPILVDFYNPENGDWNSHVDLGLWADLYVIAPATANTIAKMANGVADNLLLTTYLSAKCPVMFAPTMDLDMYKHPATLRNIEILKSYGNIVIEPTSGELASGLVGAGRMAEPEDMVAFIDSFFSKNNSLVGKKFLVTAGPTYEKIDPVRFIGNYSSGKMGYAISEELAKRGAEVVLISGPVSLSIDNPLIERINVESAKEMYDASMRFFPECDGGIMSAAVADFAPKVQASSKVKRGKDNMTIELVPNKDIAASLGSIKTDKQLLIGFALETDNEFENAQLKLEKKNLDFIVLNSLKDEGAGFGVDTNKIKIIDRNDIVNDYPLDSKRNVAGFIVDYIEKINK